MNEHDGILLDRWEATGDSQAFMELVARYQGMVFAVCFRIVRDRTTAEDLVQECFLKFTRSRPTNVHSIGPWLHRMATRSALDHLRSDRRRAVREQIYAADKELTVEAAWNDIEAILDEELNALSDESRAAIVCHYLQGHTQTEVAAILGIPRTTVRSRIEKGLDQLQRRLKARGITVPAAALASMMAANLSHAAPPGLANAMGKAVLRGQFKPQKPVRKHHRKLMSAAFAAVIALVTWIGVQSAGLNLFAPSASNVVQQPVVALSPDPPTLDDPVEIAQITEPIAPSARPVAEPAAVAEAPPEPTTIRVKCVDEAGQPISGARVYVYQSLDLGTGLIWGREREHIQQADGPLLSDGEGFVNFRAFKGAEDRTPSRVAYAIVPDKYVGIWEAAYRPVGELTEQERELLMVPSKRVSGRVLAPEGYDLGAVRVETLYVSLPPRGRLIGNTFGVAHIQDEELFPGLFGIAVDATGQFEVANIPADGRFAIRGQATGLGERQVSFMDVKQAQFVELNLEPEGAIEGTVRFAHNLMPVVGRKVYCETHSNKAMSRIQSATTDHLGKYRIEGLSEGAYHLVVGIDADPPTQIARGKGEVNVEAGLVTDQVDFDLEVGVIVTGTMSRKDSGEPVEDVHIGAVSPADSSGTCINQASTGKDGRFEIRLPLGETKLYIAAVPREIAFPEENERAVSLTSANVKPEPVDFALDAEAMDWSTVGKGFIQGRVIDSEGNPAENVLITQGHKRKFGPKEMSTSGKILGRTDPEGGFRIELSTYGTYKITFGGYEWSAHSTEWFGLEKDETKELGDITLYQYTAELSIKMLDDEGNPVPDVHYAVSAPDYYQPFDRHASDAEGMIRLKNLPETEISVRYNREGYQGNTWEGFAGESIEIVIPRE